jgi:DnaD/phage-associated family protein
MGKIIKVQLENRFTQVPNETAKAVEGKISLQALGLLTNIMSYAETWDLHKTELYKRYKYNKETSVRNAWNELVANDYIIECKIRVGKKWDYNYFIRYTPFSDAEKANIKKQIEAQTSDNNSVFWTLDFQDLKMKTSKSRDNKKRIKEKSIKEIQTSKYVSSVALNLFVENYQPLKSETESFTQLLDKHGEDLCLAAIQRTLNKGKKDNVINYIKGMLSNWKKANLTTIAEVEAHETKFRAAKEAKKKNSQQKKAANKAPKMPKAIQKGMAETAATSELAPEQSEEKLRETYEDIFATLAFLRSSEKQVLQNKD